MSATLDSQQLNVLNETAENVHQEVSYDNFDSSKEYNPVSIFEIGDLHDTDEGSLCSQDLENSEETSENANASNRDLLSDTNHFLEENADDESHPKEQYSSYADTRKQEQLRSENFPLKEPDVKAHQMMAETTHFLEENGEKLTPPFHF